MFDLNLRIAGNPLASGSPGKLRRHLRVLPSGADVVAYCRGPYCVYADEAVRERARQGYRRGG